MTFLAQTAAINPDLLLITEKSIHGSKITLNTPTCADSLHSTSLNYIGKESAHVGLHW